MRSATTFLQAHREELADDDRPVTPTQLAVLAIELHDLFVPRDERSGRARVFEPDPHEVRVELTRRRAGREPR